MERTFSRYTIGWMILAAWVLLPCAAEAWTVTSTVNRKAMTTADELMLTVTIKDAEGKVDTSSITDFDILSTMRSSSTRILDNVRVVLVEYHFQLRPKRTGVLSIPPLKVTVGGKTYRTNLQRVKVEAATGSSSGSSAGASSTGSAGNNDVFVRAGVSRLTIWEGEQFLYNYALYSRARLLGGQGHPPSFEGFTAHELKMDEGRDTYEGLQYGVTIWPFLLTPVKTGKLAIEPAQVDVQVAVRRRGGSGSLFDQFFGGSMFAGDPFGTSIDNRKLSSMPVEVEVKPLPKFDGPGVFSGLVGQFAIQAHADKESMKTGDSATLTVEIAGKGNLYDVAGPEIIPPEGLKMYEDAPEENIRSGRDGTTGSKSFRWAVVPLDPGEYTLGPFPLTYFDTRKEEYVSLTAGPVKLTVTGVSTRAASGSVPGNGRSAPEKAPGKQPAPEPKPVPVSEDSGSGDLLPLMDGPGAVVNAAPASPWVFAVLLVLPPLGYMVMCLVLRRRERAGVGARAMAARAEGALKDAMRAKGDVSACLGLLSKALVYGVRARAGMPGESLTRREVGELLGSENDLAGEVDALLEAIETARWGGTGMDPATLEKLRARTRTTVRRLVR